MKPWMRWTLVLFILYMIIQDPSASARVFDNTIDLLGRMAEGSADFVNSVLN